MFENLDNSTFVPIYYTIFIHFIQFKIRYNDLIGNLYEQKFRFGYDNYVLKGYNRNNSSYQPKLIKESQEISDFNK